MVSNIFPACCGLNILTGAPSDGPISYQAEATIASALEKIEEQIKSYETGDNAKGYCGLAGNSPHLRAHLWCVTGKQLKAKALLEKLGYVCLGYFNGAHSNEAPKVGGPETGTSYNTYLMGKGFTIPGGSK